MAGEAKYTENDLQREVRAMEKAVRAEAEKALKTLERRARSKMRELKSEVKALSSRVALLEGKSKGERVYTEAEVDAKVKAVEKASFTEARHLVDEIEERAKAAIAKWRKRAKDLGDQTAAQEEEAETAEEAAAEAEGEEDEFDLSKYRWSDRVLASVLKKFDLSDGDAVVRAAIEFDNGDRYLNRSELEEGAKAVAEKG